MKDRKTHRHNYCVKQRQTDRQADRDRDRQADRDRQRQTDRQRQRKRQTDRDRDRQADRQRQRQTDRQTDRDRCRRKRMSKRTRSKRDIVLLSSVKRKHRDKKDFFKFQVLSGLQFNSLQNYVID